MILASVEKIIMYTDVVYDLLTAVDKVGIVTDLPMENVAALICCLRISKTFCHSRAKTCLSPHRKTTNALNHIEFDVEAGEKFVLLAFLVRANLLWLTCWRSIAKIWGHISVNGYSLRDLDLTFFRDHLGGNGTAEDIFDGTWLENLTVGNPNVNIGTVLKAIEEVGLQDEVNLLPHSIETKILSHGKGLSSSTIQKYWWRVAWPKTLSCFWFMIISHSSIARKNRSYLASWLVIVTKR